MVVLKSVGMNFCETGRLELILLLEKVYTFFVLSLLYVFTIGIDNQAQCICPLAHATTQKNQFPSSQTTFCVCV